MKRALVVALGAVLLAGCGTTNPAKERGKLDGVNTKLDATLGVSPTQAAIAAAISPHRAALIEIGKTCAAPTDLTDNKLLVRCYSTAIEAYLHLSELPSAELGDLKPYALAQAVTQRAEAPCAKLGGGDPDCHAIALFDGMIESGAASAELVAMALGSTVDGARAAQLFNGHADAVNAKWPALLSEAAGTPGVVMAEGRQRALKSQACKAVWSGQLLEPRVDPALFRQFNTAFAQSSRASASALKISPCDDGGNSCPAAQACTTDPSGSDCLDRRQANLEISCGPATGMNR